MIWTIDVFFLPCVTINFQMYHDCAISHSLTHIHSQQSVVCVVTLVIVHVSIFNVMGCGIWQFWWMCPMCFVHTLMQSDLISTRTSARFYQSLPSLLCVSAPLLAAPSSLPAVTQATTISTTSSSRGDRASSPYQPPLQCPTSLPSPLTPTNPLTVSAVRWAVTDKRAISGSGLKYWVVLHQEYAAHT